MPQSTQRETDAFIEECKVQDSSLTAQDFYNIVAHAIVKSELIIERKPSIEIFPLCKKKSQKVNWNLQVPSIYI